MNTSADFAQARSQAARLIWQEVPLEDRPRRSIYDTGRGGADHSYAVEQNRRQFAADDRAATARMEIFTSVARSLEAQICPAGVRKVLADWLRYSARCDMSEQGIAPIDDELRRRIRGNVDVHRRPLANAVVQGWNLFVPIWQAEA